MNQGLKINNKLLPISWLYGIGIGIRNKLFDWNFFPVEEFSVPVISIGNLAVGGTGKTPHIEYLIRLLSPNYKVAVLSRGYKRKTSGFILADENANSERIGDEPAQMHQKFPEILVAVDANRRRGINQLLKLPNNIRPEVILLDDAFQHRYVKPSLSILLTDYRRLFDKDKLLPAGRLREPAKNKKRANIIIVTKCPEELDVQTHNTIKKAIDISTEQQLFFSAFQYKKLHAVFGEKRSLLLSELKEKNCSIFLITGIAAPQNLIKHLGNYTENLETRLFPDHHFFSRQEIEKIREDFQDISTQNKIIITTEKDAVRLMSMDAFPQELRPYVYSLPIEVIFILNQENLFIQKIEEHVKDFTRNRILA